MISLTVPGRIEYRDIAVRVIGGACKILDSTIKDSDQFATEVVSAFSEAFNNAVLHGYRGLEPGPLEIVITPTRLPGGLGELMIAITDHGHTFDPAEHQQAPDELPERGMGLFIMRSFTDELRYQPGPPNTLTLVKRFTPQSARP